MKQKSLFITFGLLLLVTGCSINNELDKDLEGKVTRITASDASKETYTTLNGNRVTWANNDALGLINVTSVTSNNHFLLTKGAGEINGVFEAVNVEDALDAGTWVAYYPYNVTKYTASRKFRVVSMTQTDNTPSHIARYDWLLSDPVTLTKAGNPDANFKLKHLFSLVEFNVKLKSSPNEYIELAQCVLESVDNTSTFAQNIYFNDQGNVVFDYTSKNVSVTMLPYVEFTTDYTTLWLAARQETLKPLSVRVYFTYGSVISSAATTFTPTNKLESGKKYVLHLELDLNDSNPNASTLSIVNI